MRTGVRVLDTSYQYLAKSLGTNVPRLDPEFLQTSEYLL